MKSLALLSAMALSAWASAATIELHLVDLNGTGRSIGTVQYEDTPYGLLLTPDLNGLPAGLQFHVHENPGCAPGLVNETLMAAGAAGGHWDPGHTRRHLGPYNPLGHKGDLPALYVSTDGSSAYPVLAPRLKAADLAGHSLMIHAGADNFSDHPMMGGGGMRMACGVF